MNSGVGNAAPANVQLFGKISATPPAIATVFADPTRPPRAPRHRRRSASPSCRAAHQGAPTPGLVLLPARAEPGDREHPVQDERWALRDGAGAQTIQT